MHISISGILNFSTIRSKQPVSNQSSASKKCRILPFEAFMPEFLAAESPRFDCECTFIRES